MDNEDKANLLNLVYEIPVVGPFLSQVLLLAVPGAILFAFVWIFGNVFEESFGLAVFSLVGFGALLWWLNFFEKRTGLRMILPLPIVSISWIWVARLGLVFGAGLAVMAIFGW